MSNDHNFSSPLSIYYHSSANNNFSFFCDYIAPVGNVNLVFPDTPCAAFASFEGYSGELSFVTELLTADLYQFWTGTTADATLATYLLLGGINAYAGETSSASILTSALFAPIAYTGEYSVVSTITLPIRAELSGDAYAGESVESSLSVTIGLDLYHYTGEYSDASLKPLQYADYIKTEGPSAYWKMDEQTGTSAIDYTGNNSPATYTNGPVLANASPVASKYAVYLDGSNDIITGPPNVTSNDLTQELWVKPDAGATITLFTASNSGTQGASGQRYAVWPYQNGSGSGGGISVGSNGIQVVAHGNSYLPILLSYQQPISTTEFTHILVSWNDRTPTLYVNGVAVATGYQARAQFNSQGLPQSGSYGYYKGYMQDVAIYPSALTADQAREHYLAGIGLHFIPRFEPVPAYTGQYVDPIEFTIDPHPNFGDINIYDGGRGTADLQANIRFYSDAYTDEYLYLNDNLLTVIPNSTFTYFYGDNGHTETSTCITLNSAVSSEAGINAGFYLPTGLNLQSISELNIRFKRTRASSWYDDDITDAQLMIWLFPNWLTSQIIWLNVAWAYDLPEERTSEGGGNAQALGINLRYNANAGFLIRWFETSTVLRSGYLTVVSNFTTNELNGTTATRIKIVTGSSGTTFTVYGENDAIRQSGTFASMPNIWTNARSTTNDIFLIHYHNYQSNRPEVICDLDIYEYEGFVLVPFIEIGTPQAYSGENALIDNLRTVSLLDPPMYSGEAGEWLFTTSPSLDLGIISNPTGENAYAILLTSSVMQIPNYAGENSYFAVSFFPSAGIGTLQGYAGEREDLDLITYAIFRDIDAKEGQNAATDLTTFPPALLVPVAYGDETAIASMQISFQLPIGRAYSGTYSVLNKIDSEPNIHFYADEAFETALSTTDTLKTTEMPTGENCLMVLQVGKSEGLGTFRVYPGTTLSTTFDTKHHADLYVMFRTSIMTQVDIGSATYFDLNTDACCGVRRETTSNNLMMHLFVKDYLPEAISDGDRVVFSLDLRCNPRFEMEFKTGGEFQFREYDGYLSIDFAEGTEGVVNSFDADLTHKLCKGYFVSNGNWLVVEMNDVLPEDCYADVFYSGTTMSCVLSDDIVIRVNNNYFGEHMSPSLTTFPPWEFIFRSGEKLHFNLALEVSTYPRGYTGETVQFRFYENPFLAYTGASGECTVTVEYFVRFKETGCLDNDFAFQNEAGDLVAELSNPLPVEGEPFYHSVLAECY